MTENVDHDRRGLLKGILLAPFVGLSVEKLVRSSSERPSLERYLEEQAGAPLKEVALFAGKPRHKLAVPYGPLMCFEISGDTCYKYTPIWDQFSVSVVERRPGRWRYTIFCEPATGSTEDRSILEHPGEEEIQRLRLE